MILGHYRTGLLIAALLCVAAQGAASALSDTELSALRSRISEERALLEQQLVRLREQQTRLDELERRATSLSSASAASVPAAENPTVGTRFGNASVTLGGSLRTTVTTSSARMQPDATPFLVLPSLPGVAEGTTKIDARLSTLLLSIRGAEVGGFQLGGLIVAQLFDGDLLSGKYGLYPGLAYVEASNNDWRFALGLQSDVFSPRIPRMVDGMSAMAGSGNAGNSTKPQLRVERLLSLGEDRITMQGALADPEPSNIAPASLASTENTGTPNVEGRIARNGNWVCPRPLAASAVFRRATHLRRMTHAFRGYRWMVRCGLASVWVCRVSSTTAAPWHPIWAASSRLWLLITRQCGVRAAGVRFHGGGHRCCTVMPAMAWTEPGPAAHNSRPSVPTARALLTCTGIRVR